MMEIETPLQLYPGTCYKFYTTFTVCKCVFSQSGNTAYSSSVLPPTPRASSPDAELLLLRAASQTTLYLAVALDLSHTRVAQQKLHVRMR